MSTNEKRLRDYARHLPDCLGGLSGDRNPCVCGLNELLAATTQSQDEPVGVVKECFGSTNRVWADLYSDDLPVGTKLYAAPLQAPEPAQAQEQVWRVTFPSGEQCHFGVESMAHAYAGKTGTVEPVPLRTFQLLPPLPKDAHIVTGDMCIFCDAKEPFSTGCPVGNSSPPPAQQEAADTWRVEVSKMADDLAAGLEDAAAKVETLGDDLLSSILKVITTQARLLARAASIPSPAPLQAQDSAWSSFVDGIDRRTTGPREPAPQAAVPSEPTIHNEEFIVYLDMNPIDVVKHYATIHKMPLPPTPTMNGCEIRRATGRDDTALYYLFLEEDGFLRRHIGDAEAVPLKRGMEFFLVPPATY